MLSVSIVIILMTALAITDEQAINSYNTPSFCLFPSWNTGAVTFANSYHIGNGVRGIFIDKNNTIYIPTPIENKVTVWVEGSNVPKRNLSGNLSEPMSIFVTHNGDIYVDNGKQSQIAVWKMDGTTKNVSLDVTDNCHGLFIDINDTLYCSFNINHKVVKKSLSTDLNTSIVAAGTGSAGTTPDTLNKPRGIFVNINFDLYVADCGNNRIQLFKSGSLNATSAAGTGAPGTIDLYWPTGITVDANNYLYVVDEANHRIVGSGPHGFRCLVGCFGTGSSEYQLNHPQSLAFDSYGNMYVTDRDNNRVQKFLLATKSCDLSYNQPTFCSSPFWNANETTLKTDRTNNTQLFSLFITRNNTIYATDTLNNWVEMWANNTDVSIKIMKSNLTQPLNLFVTSIGDIFLDNGKNTRIDQWMINGTTSFQKMNVNESCFGLFIDLNNNLYCSIQRQHQVIQLSLTRSDMKWNIVAGNGSTELASNTLNKPSGIYVDTKLNLYIADCGNNRIQLFKFRQFHGTTVTGNGLVNNIKLNCPTGVVLDMNDNLYVTDFNNHRIVVWESNRSRCLIGCSSEWNPLSLPLMMNFDSFGNMFVTAFNNSRIQKFTLASNSCTDVMLLTTPTPIQSLVSPVFPPCNDSQYTGKNCNVSNNACNMFQPCENNGVCISDHNGYHCSCSSHYNGKRCEVINPRSCAFHNCSHRGICSQVSNEHFNCSCDHGWEGTYCELMVNFCNNNTCQNKGVCRPLLRNFTCQCLADSYYGEYCEHTKTRIIILKIVSKSVSYVAIIAMSSIAMFVIIMDILKYCFGIDPVEGEREKLRREKQRKKRRRRPVIQRFVYVNTPVPLVQQSTTDPIDTY